MQASACRRLKAGLQTATVRSAGFSLPPPKGGTTNDRLKAGLRTKGDFDFRLRTKVDSLSSMQDTCRQEIGFIGAGKMATALAKGFIRAGIVNPEQILASDVSSQALDSFAAATGSHTCKDNTEVVRNAHVIILAVKPDCVQPVLDQIKAVFTPDHLLISIAAGIKIESIQQALCPGARVVRVMPNTPAVAGASASAFAKGGSALPEDVQLTAKLFGAVGEVVEVKERLLDAVTGLSGSGPAYVCLVIEALSDGGVAAGLPRDTAIRLAAQTVLGTAKMVLESGIHPAALRDMVTSPGGTTIEGLHQLEKSGVRAAFISAVRAAAEKSQQLGKPRC